MFSSHDLFFKKKQYNEYININTTITASLYQNVSLNHVI